MLFWLNQTGHLPVSLARVRGKKQFWSSGQPGARIATKIWVLSMISLASIEQKGIKIILVDVGETKEDVKNYFNRRQMKLVSFVDEDSFLQEIYHLIGVPTLIFIDEKGIIRNVTHEFPSDYENYFSAK